MPFALGVLLAGLTAVEYSQLVGMYRSGSFEQAVQSLEEADLSVVRESSRAFVPATKSERRAVVLLHSEAAMRNVERESVHLEAAEKFLEGIDDPAFLRRWRLLMARHFRSLMRPWNAIPHLEAARALFPQDVEVTLEAGKAYEMAGWLGSKKMLENAARMFQAVIDADGGQAEAHLRLGRVRELLGDPNSAVAEIERGLGLSDGPGIQLPANLLLGDLHEARGDLARAIRLYQAAVEADPYCQPAAIALSHALYRARDYEGSREVIEAFLMTTPRETDYWWRYVQGDRRLVDRRLEELREEVRH